MRVITRSLLGFVAALSAPAVAQVEVKTVTREAVQECKLVTTQTCSTKRNIGRCDAWHEKQAPGHGADTVVVVDSDKNMQFLGFIGKRSEVKADYYNCHLPDVEPPPPYDPWENLDPAKYRTYGAPGNTELRGQAFLRQRGGDVVTCAGSKVAIIPESLFVDMDTSASEVIRLLFSGQSQQPDYLAGVIRITTCDAQGNFAFRRLPPASWRVLTNVVWSAPEYGRLQAQGGELSATHQSSIEADPVYLTETDLVSQ